MMTKQDRLKAEMKLLTAIYAHEVFEGQTVRQGKPHCCGKVIDLFTTNVTFRQITIGKKVFHLIEPSCPICGSRIKANCTLLA